MDMGAKVLKNPTLYIKKKHYRPTRIYKKCQPNKKDGGEPQVCEGIKGMPKKQVISCIQHNHTPVISYYKNIS